MGMLKHAMTWLKKNLALVLAELLKVGIALTHLVK